MEQSTTVELAVLLPDVPDERDACVGRLTESLASHRGISQVHVVADADTSESRVCIHYDPGLVSLTDVQRMATRAGADVASKDPSASQSESGCCVRILPDPASYISSLAYMTDTDWRPLTTGGPRVIETTLDLKTKAKLFKGFSDPSRLSILEVLRGGPVSVGEIVEATGLSQPNTSNHLSCLLDCGLVTREQRGRFVFYELADGRVDALLGDAEALLSEVARGVEACGRYDDA